MQLRNRIGDKILRHSAPTRAIRFHLIAGCLVALLVPGEAAAERDELAIGITQFPATLNPNLEAMAAKSYVLGAALRPFTVYDPEWKLVCLLLR